MTITKYPHGIHATPNLGGTGRLMELWENDNIYFVDATDGSSSNDGKHPTKSKALPSQAITACSQGASIYIRPYIVDQSATSQEVYYTDDIIIPYDKSGIALMGAGMSQPFNYGGVGIRPTTVTGSLITVKSNSNLIENLYLTLNGGTSDSGTGTNPQCIINMRRVTTSGSQSRNYGNQVRGCRFSQDKSHPSVSANYGSASIYLGCAVHTIIEDNIFEECLGSIVLQSVVGNQEDTHIRRNTFGGICTSRDADMIISINSANANNIVVYDNMFADGLPTHSSGSTLRFVAFPYITAGTGLFANNYFACLDKEAEFDEIGSEAKIAAEFFAPGNWCAATSTTAGAYGIIQPGS